MFDIDFALIKKNNNKNSKKVFNRYSNLLEQINTIEIINKFLILAQNSNLTNWQEYLLNEKKFYNQEITKKVYIQNMKQIKRESKVSKLISLIKHKIIIINENI